jgi:hypothetical protein
LISETTDGNCQWPLVNSSFQHYKEEFGGVNQGLSGGFETSQYAFFVRTHQAAVSGDIRRQNCRKPPFHAIVGHNGLRDR